MNRVAVPNAVQLVGASREGPEVSAEEHERCIQQFVLSVVRTLRFLSDPMVTDRCIVAIASAE